MYNKLNEVLRNWVYQGEVILLVLPECYPYAKELKIRDLCGKNYDLGLVCHRYTPILSKSEKSFKEKVLSICKRYNQCKLIAVRGDNGFPRFYNWSDMKLQRLL